MKYTSKDSFFSLPSFGKELKEMDSQPCEHLKSCIQDKGIDKYRIISAIFVTPLSNQARKRKASEAFCYECHCKSNRIHACLSCVYFGCMELNHLMDHALELKHNIGVDLDSGNVFCFVCNDYTYDDDLTQIHRRNKSKAGQINGIVPYFSWLPTSSEIKLILENGGIKQIRDDSYIGLRGLFNFGNTCFMNCILQVLAHISLLRNYFLSDKHHCEREHCTVCEMFKLFQEFYSGNTAPYNPVKLIHSLWIHSKELAGYQQQDAHEFFLSFLNVLHTHCVESEKTSKDHDECKCIIHQLFFGVMQNDMICNECQDVSTTSDPFSDMSLDLSSNDESSGKDQKPVKQLFNLEERIHRYVSNEILEDSSCSQCGCKSRTKQYMIKKLPIVACFHLKRLVTTQKGKTKIVTPVEFPEILDMSPFMSSNRNSKSSVPEESISSCMKGGENKYVLIGVVNHEGRSSGGHYFSYIRQLRNHWYKCNDIVVSKAPFSRVLGSEGYILIYHKQTLEYQTESTESIPNGDIVS